MTGRIEFPPGAIISVLTAEPIDRLLDYRAPQSGCTQNDFLEIPLGPRKVLGIVWGAGTGTFSPDKLRSANMRLDIPPLTPDMRAFLERASAYTLTPLHMMLRLATRAPDLLKPAKQIKTYHLGNRPPARMTPQRQKVLEVAKYSTDSGLTLEELRTQAGVSSGVIKSLENIGALVIKKVAYDRPFAKLNPDQSRPPLSPDQQKAADEICKSLTQNHYSTTLLKGVTGSGKTEVYIEAIRHCLRNGRSALVLLPEIALTSPFLELIKQRFGAYPAQWHSGVSPVKRRRCWNMVAQGHAQLVVGARSALYLPFQNLGLIVVDEEHDSSYKQEEGALYNARDMAVLRASLADAHVVLASATPSLESWANAKSGKYHRINLPKRFSGSPLPTLTAIDMREEKLPSGRWISSPLQSAINHCLDQKKQALLFLNRRGFAPITLCRSCGHQIGCQNCDARLVAHKSLNRLLCHQCAHTIPTPKTCPACESEGQLVAIGPGVERLGEEANALFPNARVTVLSSDLFGSLNAMKQEIAQIAKGKADIIIGTQLIAKGHNFPNLTLVGVIDADLGLQGSDLRAAERSFQVIHQVAGRAGRADAPGTALIQTWQPDHPVIRAILSQEDEAFWQAEADARQAAGAPPFGRFVGIILCAPDFAEINALGKAMAQNTKTLTRIGAIIYGPAPAPIARLRGRYRLRLLIKCPRGRPLQNAIKSWVAQFSLPKRARLSIDIDPQSFY